MIIERKWCSKKKIFCHVCLFFFLDTQKKLTIFLKQRGETSISSQKRHFGSLSKNLLRKPGEDYIVLWKKWMNFPLNDRFASQNNKDKNFSKYLLLFKGEHLAHFFEKLRKNKNNLLYSKKIFLKWSDLDWKHEKKNNNINVSGKNIIELRLKSLSNLKG